MTLECNLEILTQRFYWIENMNLRTVAAPIKTIDCFPIAKGKFQLLRVVAREF